MPFFLRPSGSQVAQAPPRSLAESSKREAFDVAFCEIFFEVVFVCFLFFFVCVSFCGFCVSCCLLSLKYLQSDNSEH